MPKCSFKYCKNVTSRTTKTDGISYFRFPQDPKRRAEWIAILSLQRREQYFRPKDSCVVCSKHFSEEDIYVTDKGITRLHKTAVPRVPIEVKIEPIDNDETNLFGMSSTDETNIKRELDSPSIEVPVVGGNPDHFHKDSPTKRELNSPTTILMDPACYSHREFILKRELTKCRERLKRREKDCNNLIKKNKRLLKNKIMLKNMVNVLKKRLKSECRKGELEINI